MWQTKGTKTCVQWAAGLGTFQQAPAQWCQSIKHVPDAHETAFRNDALPHSGGDGAKVEVSRLSKLIFPWKLWWLKFFLFSSQNPFFLTFLYLFSSSSLHCFSSSLVFSPSFVYISLFFSSKKHLSHSHSYSFSRSLPASCKATDSEMQESWPHLPEMGKKKKKHKE